MDHIGIDVHKRDSQICIVTHHGLRSRTANSEFSCSFSFNRSAAGLRA